jgi:uncharacterized protein YegP (UPF0339 family)
VIISLQSSPVRTVYGSDGFFGLLPTTDDSSLMTHHFPAGCSLFTDYSLKKETHKMKFHIYKDSRGEWRWRLKAANGKILAESGEGYNTKQACKEGIELVKGAVSAAVVEDFEGPHSGRLPGGPHGADSKP